MGGKETGCRWRTCVIVGGEEDEVAVIYKSDVWFLAKEQNGQVACAVNAGKRVAGSRTGNIKKEFGFC